MTDIAYTYDGSLEGLLCAIFAAYANRENPCDIVRANNLQPRLGQTVRAIETDTGIAVRVQKGICRTCGPTVFDAVKSASLSDDPATGTIIYRFVRHGMSAHRPHDCTRCARKARCSGLCSRTQKNSVMSDLAHPVVAPFHELNRAVYNERHRMMQFLRFEHLENNVWFARCNPKASVVPLLMDWFVGRFNTQPFMIYDEVHRIAGVYEGCDWHLVKTDVITVPQRSAEEQAMQAAWKRFYDTVAVESRYNPELRRQFMPKRFWKNIVEMQETVPRRKGDTAPPEQICVSASGIDGAADTATAALPYTPLPSNAGMKLSAAAPPSCQK